MFGSKKPKQRRFGNTKCCRECCVIEAGQNSICTLDQLPPGGKAVICNVGGQGSHRRKLLDMGLTPNTSVMVRKVAPLGDPIELFLRNYELTLRREDARRIKIKEVQA